MDISDSHRSTSFRVNSSSIWRNNGVEIFSTSWREDDEEALKWAAIQRIPTYDRLKKGLMAVGSKGETTVIDIEKLGYHEKKNLIERLIKVTEEDNEKFLLKLKARIDRVGIDIPTVEVRFEHLNVVAEAYVGSRSLPSFTNFFLNILEGVLSYLHLMPNRKKSLSILRDISGIIKPARMTLLLGPPSSGKSTLLLALAGKLHPDLKFSGRVSYNGHDMHEFVPLRTAAYISQHDLHTAEMTVRETLVFSAKCQGVGSRYEMLMELSRREKAANIKPDPDIDIFMKAASTDVQEANVIVDYILKVLGLEVCADTLVGNEMLSGISGGQRKRLTTGEMLVGPSNVLLMDEISSGLDSSTTFQIINLLKHYIHILKGSAVISLLQPAPETYNLFDDIILLSDGHIVYQGPREHVLAFFEQMGFKCPDRKGVADFLQEVTSKRDQMQYWVHKDETYNFVTAKEFSEAFQLFHVGKCLLDELSISFQKSKSHPAALTTKKYGVRKKEILKTCFSKEFLLMKRKTVLYISKTAMVSIVALVTMTLFLRTKMHRDSLIDGVVFNGSLFFALTLFLFLGYSEMTTIVAQLPVFYKQRDLLFYPAWAYSLPTWILHIPMTIVEASIWVFCTYYVIGYDPTVGRFFRQWLLLLVFRQMASGLFRLAASVGRKMDISFTFGSFVMIMFFALGGFVLSREDVKKWWIWAYWISPLMYGQNAIAVNEFRGKSWKHVLPFETEPLGVIVLKSRGLFPEEYWYWLGVGALIGFTFLFNFLFMVALTYLRPWDKPQAFISDDILTGETQLRSSLVQTTEDNANEIGIMSSSNRRRGMVLPFEQYSITFDDIKYSVDMPQGMKNQGVCEDKLELLKGVSGALRPGVLTALMGVSGAGKTTLLDVLAGRKTGGYIQGSIKISGYPKRQETFARISGYCEQNDIHSPHITVHESLLFSAWLRLPSEVTSEARKMFIEEVMELVELTSLKGALVGLPGVNGLSTEQRKRLTIAVELVANPSIIFMDEPTSGIDARAAEIVMRTVRNIVDTGRTIVCTIHQPSIHIFESFDELYLMKSGGEEIYVGPIGPNSCHLINYFEGIEGISKIKDDYNPATWVLEITTREQEEILGINFIDVYKSSELYRRNKALIKELSIPLPGLKDLYFLTQYSRSFFTQFKGCLWKQHWSYWRNTTYTGIRFLSTTVIALLFGTIFWDIGMKRKTQQDLFNAIGSMYTAVLFLGIQNACSVQPVTVIERTVFYRERAAGTYSAMPYAFAQAVIELPHILAQACVYGVLVFAMIGFEWGAAKFFWFLFFIYFTLLYFTCFGMMTASISPNVDIATVISSPFYTLWNLFSGYIVPRPHAPIWWRWFYWINPFQWTLYGLVASQYGDIPDELELGITIKQFMRSYFGFRHDFLGEVAAVLVGFALLFAVAYAFSMKAINFQNR